jgi:topoisomerase IV subunit A
MYVILDRALPHIGDGLKPVQRRIVYAMSELGLSAGPKPKKSARTVGDVIGKFHPHGDSACYEAMVLMAQPFSLPLPDRRRPGQLGRAGRSEVVRRDALHRGAADALRRGAAGGAGPGHGRLAAELRRHAERAGAAAGALPNLLLNGASGIAVGMSTDIPPHNLREVAAACIHLLENPKATLDELLRARAGAGLPDRRRDHHAARDIAADLRDRQRHAAAARPLGARGRRHRDHRAAVQVSGSKVLEQIAAQMRAKKLPMVEDLRDESDHENPTRLVIVPRSNRTDATR